MPKLPMDYSNTYFYKLVCKDTNISDCYVGHTTHFAKRKNHHKYCCITPSDQSYNHNVYQFIRNNGGWDNWEMILIEKEDCENHLDALKKERYYKEQLNATLNMLIPSRNNHDYYMDTRHIQLPKSKERYKQKRQEIREYANTKITCECGKRINRSGIAKHRASSSIEHQQYLQSLEN